VLPITFLSIPPLHFSLPHLIRRRLLKIAPFWISDAIWLQFGCYNTRSPKCSLSNSSVGHFQKAYWSLQVFSQNLILPQPCCSTRPLSPSSEDPLSQPCIDCDNPLFHPQVSSKGTNIHIYTHKKHLTLSILIFKQKKRKYGSEQSCSPNSPPR